MSRLIDKLVQVSQGNTRPLGFRPSATVSGKPRIQMVASLTGAEVENLPGRLAGADAGLLHISKTESKALEKVCQASADTPLGVWLSHSEGIEKIVEAKCDFVVFPASASLAVIKNEKLGAILEVESSLSDGLVRAINDLPVNAVLISVEQKKDVPLTWQNLMLFQHFAHLLDKPLLVTAPSNVTADELKAIWEAGVTGVVVEAGADGLTALRQAMEKVTFAPRQKGKKGVALVPRLVEQAGEVVEEEEEEEE